MSLRQSLIQVKCRNLEFSVSKRSVRRLQLFNKGRSTLVHAAEQKQVRVRRVVAD